MNEQAAELYFHTPGAISRKAVSYRRFENVAEAVSFVMNEVSTRDRNSCFLEFGEDRLGYDEIAKLHNGSKERQQTGETT